MESKNGKIILIVSAGLVLMSLYHFVFFSSLFNPIYFFHICIFILMNISLVTVSKIQPLKVLFSFLVWTGIKIVGAGIFMAWFVFQLGEPGKKILLLSVINFLGLYVLSVIFEVWAAYKLTK